VLSVSSKAMTSLSTKSRQASGEISHYQKQKNSSCREKKTQAAIKKKIAPPANEKELS
jgi:hypothetical protein